MPYCSGTPQATHQSGDAGLINGIVCEMVQERPQLHNRAAFEEAIAHLHVSERAADALRSTPYVVLTGLAGGGRNTAIKDLQKYGYKFVVSDTTRPPKRRDGVLEQDGVSYNFRSEETMLADIQQGEFIEAEIIHEQQVSGTSIRAIEHAAATGLIPINEIEFGGVNNTVKAKPDTIVIALLPPSYEEWLRRLQAREDMQPDELLDRLRTAKSVIDNIEKNPQFNIVINDDLESCVSAIRRIVEENEYSDQDNVRGHDIASELQKHINDALSTH